MTSLGFIDCCMLVTMMVASICIGIYYAWTGRKGTNEDFLMGGRKMNVFPVAISLMASFLSPISIMGVPAEIPWLGVVLYSPSLVLKSTLGLSTVSSVLITGVAVTIYTSLGGIKAVVWTDVLQYTLMIIGIIVVIIKGTIDIGGVKNVWLRSLHGGRMDFSNYHFNIYMSNNFWSVVLGTSLIWSGGYSTSQMLVQRTCTLTSLSKAKRVVYVSLPGFQIMTLMMTYLGVLIFAYYYTCDPLASSKIGSIDEIVPFFVTDIMGSIPGLPGLFVSSVCSASLSTLSSGLNAIAALVWEDWFSKCFKNVSQRVAVVLTKLLAACVGGICILMAFVSTEVGTIFEAAYALSGAPIGPVFGVFLMGLILPFVNAKGAITGLICGQISCFVIIIGALTNKHPKGVLKTSTESCSAFNSTNEISSLPFSALRNYSIPNYEPEGFNQLFHLSHYVVPIFGFFVTVVIGIVVSFLTGFNKNEKIDPKLLNPHVAKLLGFKVNSTEVNDDGFKGELVILSDEKNIKYQPK
ncbi:sodium-coupled monocarboxylate transporter 1-like protein 1 [Dinothrombium tinctorium]|uniref:Sodium-coupled monocarboxylate transporter 1-like protein 1 n=1 Tax=Dinothrombium tinctorium TaxID=1965070 RepID=A0A3S4QR91_9ACAR|nr:sodium-coupled monocarboxylate transporter 1-like protein 1 [Dinothrombium tinctorium]